jgi:glutamate-1-semialdehyde 2,1-aminomutase
LTERYGVVLVFDEIVTGFRINLGGAQAEFGITPDLACFGKAMANGMPISVVLGRREIMDRMYDIFFSGTFGGEALSLAAANATIDKLARTRASSRIRARGRRLIAGTNKLLATHKLADVLKVGGADWMPRWKLQNCPVHPDLLHSLLRQEMAANGLLALASLNLCLAHDDDGIEAETLAALDSTFSALAFALNASDPQSHLRGPAITPVFQVRAS